MGAYEDIGKSDWGHGQLERKTGYGAEVRSDAKAIGYLFDILRMNKKRNKVRSENGVNQPIYTEGEKPL